MLSQVRVFFFLNGFQLFREFGSLKRVRFLKVKRSWRNWQGEAELQELNGSCKSCFCCFFCFFFHFGPSSGPFGNYFFSLFLGFLSKSKKSLFTFVVDALLGMMGWWVDVCLMSWWCCVFGVLWWSSVFVFGLAWCLMDMKDWFENPWRL